MTSREEEQQPMTTREGITCYERDETLCNDRMCLRTGCRLRNERLASRQEVSVEELASIYGQTLATDLLANYVITKRTTEG